MARKGKGVTVGGEWISPTCSALDLSLLLGISVRAVRDYAARGIFPKATQRGRFETLPSVNAYCKHLQQRAAGHATESGSSLADERAKSEVINRRIQEIKLAQLSGEVLTLDEVSEAWSAIARQFKASVLSIPGRARSTIPHLTPHDGEVLKLLCREVLETMAEEVEAGVVGAEARELVKA
ncbi:MAG: hypothetical protein EA385_15085 [Salinarimonadaceae bacterium]|nr:MAG: hypothetical protein EA385_15085 [Salinarimonadaceae bacterium]